jgi:hypothetical protein
LKKIKLKKESEKRNSKPGYRTKEGSSQRKPILQKTNDPEQPLITIKAIKPKTLSSRK